LPLISDIVKSISIKKIFNKLDLHWGYNNIWIKKGDEWKVAFMTLKESFKPMVMFFSLMNLLTIFQVMINEILQKLINTGEVASFIDNVIVWMKEDDDDDEVVKEVVKRLAENDLYVKLGKYK